MILSLIQDNGAISRFPRQELAMQYLARSPRRLAVLPHDSRLPADLVSHYDGFFLPHY
jgi:hypothetical protein